MTEADNAKLTCVIAPEHVEAARPVKIIAPGANPSGYVWLHILVAHNARFLLVVEYAPRLNAWQMSVASLCHPMSTGLKQHKYKVNVMNDEGDIEQCGFTWSVTSPFAGRKNTNGYYSGVLVANTISLMPYAIRASKKEPGDYMIITELVAEFSVLAESREVPAPSILTFPKHPLFAAACTTNVINGQVFPKPIASATAVTTTQATPAQVAAFKAFAAISRLSNGIGGSQ
jgi:hypothetical protein